MKKMIACLLSLAMVLSLAACSGTSGEPAPTEAAKEAETQAAKEQKSETETTAAATEAAAGDPWDNLETLVIPIYSAQSEGFATNRFSDTWLGSYILDKFNVDFELFPAPADADTFYSTALVGGDYPEILSTTNLNVLLSYEDAGTLICLDDYQDKLQTFYATLGDAVIEKARSQSADGKLYNWYYNTPCGPTMQLSYTNLNDWTVRADQLEEYGADKMPYTYDEWLEFFKAMQAAHPTAPDGTAAYAMSFPGAESWAADCVFQGGSIRDGVHTKVTGSAAFNTVTDKWDNYYTSEGAKACVKFFNDLYKAGCLDPESFTLQDGDVAQKAANGYIYAFTVANWNDAAINEALPTVYGDPDHAVIQVPFSNVDGKHIRAKQIENSRMIALTDKLTGDKLDRVLALLDWYFSEEGQLMYGSGEEGVDFEWQDGKRVPIGKFKEEIVNGFAEGYAYTRGTYESYALSEVLGASWDDCPRDGQPYRLNRSAAIASELGTNDYQKKVYKDLGWENNTSWWTENTVLDPNVLSYGIVSLTTEDAEYDAGYITCPDIARNYAAKLAFADDFDATWADFEEALEKAGINEFIDAVNAKYDAVKAGK